MYRFRKLKTSDFFETNLRTFEAKHRNFSLKKSDVFDFRTGSEPPQFFVGNACSCMPAQVRPAFRGGPLCRGLREMECNGAENAVTAIPHANVSQQGPCPMTGPFHACRRVCGAQFRYTS